MDTLESISTQSYQNWECLIVDDGSTDNTNEVVMDYIKQQGNDKYRYFRIENSGTSKAKNFGIERANGDYIQFLDADDILSTEKLAIQAGIVRNAGMLVVFSRSVFFKDVDDKRIFEKRYPDGYLAESSLTGTDLLVKLVTNNLVTISGPLVSKDLIIQAGKFDQNLNNNEDWMLWFKVAMINPEFTFDDNGNSYVMVRIHGNSAMKQKNKMFEGEVVVRNSMDLVLEGEVKILNNDLLALHRIRSLNAKQGYNYILNNFSNSPFRYFKLLGKGVYRSMVRLYKQLS